MTSFKSVIFIFGLFFISQTLSSIIDIFEATNGHEPRVAIQCGKVPFKIDLKTGAWVEDSTGIAHCDEDKNDVKRFVAIFQFLIFFFYVKIIFKKE